MSVAVGTHKPYGDNLARTVIRRLVARDEAARIDVVVDPGALIESSRIHRHSTGYSVMFAIDGRQLRCALAQFQARTEPAVRAGVDEGARPEATIAV